MLQNVALNFRLFQQLVCFFCYNEEVKVDEYEVNGKELEVVNDFKIINELGYNGEIEDNLDLQYLRARYYRQDSARFISEDTYRGDIGRGQSHNAYIYTENGGVNNVDPSGESIVHRGAGYSIIKIGSLYKVHIAGAAGSTKARAAVSSATSWLLSKGVMLFYATYIYNSDMANVQGPIRPENHVPTSPPKDSGANNYETPREPTTYYVNQYGLDPNDTQFTEWAVMCDKLEDSGLSTEEIKGAIESFSLDELQNFLEWKAETGRSFSEWKAEQALKDSYSETSIKNSIGKIVANFFKFLISYIANGFKAGLVEAVEGRKVLGVDLGNAIATKIDTSSIERKIAESDMAVVTQGKAVKFLVGLGLLVSMVDCTYSNLKDGMTYGVSVALAILQVGIHEAISHLFSKILNWLINALLTTFLNLAAIVIRPIVSIVSGLVGDLVAGWVTPYVVDHC